MFGKGKREREKLEQSGRRAPATVVEIARFGWASGDAAPGRASTHSENVRMTTLRVEPEGEPPFEVKKRLRYGDVPKAGDRIEVLYDPADHDKVMLAPLTVEQQNAIGAAALRDSNIGFAVQSSPGGAMPAEAMEAHRQALEQAQQAQALMQQVMGGGAASGPGADQAVAQLEALRDSGAMTEEQFQAARAHLLGEA
jgi:hypothetical protein